MALFIIALCVAVCMAQGPPQDDLKWQDYKLEFNKHYAEGEEETRYNTWKKAVSEVELHNAKYDESFKQGINQFSDMTDEEFEAQYLGYNPSEVDEDRTPWFPSNGPVPNDVDWRQQGMVTPVKNQGACGSCYSFSTTGALEGAWKKKTGNLISMSEQQIVDCSGRWGNGGCHGGRMQSAFKYIRDVGGIVKESYYPYYPRQGRCKFSHPPSSEVVAKVRAVQEVRPHRSEDALKQAIAANGPISVAIDASASTFRRYRSGVHYSTSCSSTRLNHAVLAVGYGTENGQDYFLVKNSWGTRWGAGGYIKMARNRGNNCGISNDCSFPAV
jgi:cathepsin L